MANIFEILLSRLREAIPTEHLVPNHQFESRENYSTVQQCHRIVIEIKETIEVKKMRAAVFLDIEQALDKVWHEGLLF